MRLSRKFKRRTEVGRRASLSAVLILGFALSACSTQTQNQPVTAAAPAGVQYLESCSTLGVIACGAVSMLSGDAAVERRSTCVAYRTANNTLVETCGSVQAREPDPTPAKIATTKPPSVPLQANGLGHNVLTWSANSNNEDNFIIERCDQLTVSQEENKQTVSCAGVWKSIGTVPAHVTQYVDDNATVDQTYLYRVKAANTSGSSGYSNEAMITTPSR